MRFLALFLLMGFYSFGQQSQKGKAIINPEAKSFNQSAIRVLAKSKDCKKALFFFDKAISKDSNYVEPLKGKIACLIGLKQYKKAIKVAQRWNQIDSQILSPFPNPSSVTGMLYERLSDTTNSKIHFNYALTCLDNILDTMHSGKTEYVLMEKAIILILLGEHKKGNDILQYLHENSKENIVKLQVLLFLNKPRQDVISKYFHF
jgi:tetratricopeptide (TPR) repeat protein